MLSKEEFINQEVNKPYVYEDIKHLNKKLIDGEKVIFTKFGDGEYQCMTLQKIGNTNADNDIYTYEFGIKLKEAFYNLCDRSDKENIYIGKWHTNEVSKFYCNILYDYYIENNKKLKSIPFVNYHFCQIDYNFNKNNNLLEFVKTIKYLNKTKIIFANEKNKKLAIIFNANYHLIIPEISWFANGYYNKLEEQLNELLTKYNDALILFAGGMGSKIIISNLSNRFQNASFIDIGSSFEILATKNDLRGWRYICKEFTNSYENQLEYFKEVLPDNYDTI
jgi:hypothetical protein